MTGPLTGFKIVDLTSLVMGPFATQIFGDPGAAVINVASGHRRSVLASAGLSGDEVARRVASGETV